MPSDARTVTVIKTLSTIVCVVSIIFLAVVVSFAVIGGSSVKEGDVSFAVEESVLPIVVATWANEKNREAVQAAWDLVIGGKSGLVAVEKGINKAELFPTAPCPTCPVDPTYTLDAMIMSGPNHTVGAVGSMKRIKTAITVARHVMEHTGHTLIAGDDATKSATSMGVKEEDSTAQSVIDIGMIVVDEDGDITAGTSTDGFDNEVAGRVGDSSIPGAGVYVENSVGAAAASGDGDIMMRHLPAFHVVMLMKHYNMRRVRPAKRHCG